MSQDGGVYILVTKDRYIKKGRYAERKDFTAYRVAYVQGIDQLNYLQENEPHNVGCYLLETWGKSKVYESLDEALIMAGMLGKVHEFLEYGIQVIETEYSFYVK